MISKLIGSFLLCVLIFTNNTVAQDITYLEEKIESTTTSEDKLKLYIQLADTLMWIGSDLDKAKKYADKVLEECEGKACGNLTLQASIYLAEFGINRGDFSILENVIIPKLEKDNFQSKILKAHYEEVVGGYYLINGQTEKSIYHLTIAEDLLKKENPTSKRLSNIYHYLAYSYNINSRNDSSIFFIKKEIEHSKSLKDSLKIMDGYSGLSTLYSTDGDAAKAVDVLLKAIDIMNHYLPAKDQKYFLYGSLVNLYINNKDYEKAKKELLQLIPDLMAEELPMELKVNDLWSFNMSMAKLLGRMNEPKKALAYVDSAYVYANRINDFTVLITDLRRASLHLKAGNYELAKEQFEQLVLDSKESGKIDAFNAVLVGQLADLYTKSSLKPTPMVIDNFLPVVDRIIEKNKDLYNLDLLEAQKLSTILGLYTSNSKRVANGLKEIFEIQDTLQSQEKTTITNELLIQYQTKEQEKELEINALALAKKTTQRNALIGAALALLILLTVLGLYYQQKRKYATTLEAEVKKRTADLKASNEALIQSNKELERYTYIASHDLKEPLRDVINFTTLIKRKGMLEDKATLKYFDFVEKGAVQINRIVQDIVDFSDIRNLNLTIETVKIFDIIDAIHQEFTTVFETKNIVLHKNNIPSHIQSNQTLLFMIFKNIIENGIKYNNNSVVKIDISYLTVNNHHQFSIRDNGIGIDEQYFEKIFEMFKRLHNRSEYEGSGIGLAICKRSVDYLNGTISVESEVGKGTEFIITLPIIEK